MVDNVGGRPRSPPDRWAFPSWSMCENRFAIWTMPRRHGGTGLGVQRGRWQIEARGVAAQEVEEACADGRMADPADGEGCSALGRRLLASAATEGEHRLVVATLSAASRIRVRGDVVDCSRWRMGTGDNANEAATAIAAAVCANCCPSRRKNMASAARPRKRAQAAASGEHRGCGLMRCGWCGESEVRSSGSTLLAVGQVIANLNFIRKAYSSEGS